jgi:iron complex outermembrane receptor protein
MFKYRTVLLCAAATGGLLAHPVAAQSANQAAGQAAGQQPAAQNGGGEIADIIVTAQRRDQNLQKAAVSLTAITGDAISQANVVRADDLAKLAPSLEVSSGGSARTQTYLRGVGSAGENSYAENAVAFNYDGVYVSSPGGVNGLFFDLQRVEVLNGPQGTLYGRNATGGAINVIPHAPDYALSAGASVSYGNYNALQTDGFVNVPLVDQKLALRAAFQTSKHDGYYNDGYGDNDSKSVRLQVLWQPDPDLKIKLGADYSERTGVGPGAHLASLVAPDTANVWDGLHSPSATALFGSVGLPPLGQSPFTGASYSDNQDNHFYGVNSTIIWRTSIGTLTVIPAYRHAGMNYTDDIATFDQVLDESENQVSLEARLASDESRPLRYLVGVFGFKEELKAYADLNQVINETIPLYDLHNKSGAAFGQMTYAITPAFRLTAGLRFTAETKTQNGTATIPVEPGAPGSAPIVIPPALAPVAQQDGDATFHNVTYKIGGEWDVGRSNLLYANYGTGFKAGGFYAATTNNSYQPEKLDAWTIGSKNRFFNNKLQINIEAFYWKYKDQQFSHLEQRADGELVFATENVGKSTIKGIDLDLQYALTKNDRVSLIAQYNDAAYTQFAFSQADFGGAADLALRTSCPFTATSPITFTVNCTGKHLPFAPELTLTATAAHTFHFANGAAIIAEARTNYETTHYVTFDFVSNLEQKSITRSSFNLTYTSPNDRLKIAGFVDNIENHAVKQGGQINPFFPLYDIYLKPPRTAGVRVSVLFGK